MEEQWQEALQILNRAKSWSCDPVIYTSLGDCYKALKQYEKAEQAYLHASNITPGMFYPLYLLAKLYDDSNQPIKEKQIARKVMQKEVKIPSTAIKVIKQAMQIIIPGNELMNLE